MIWSNYRKWDETVIEAAMTNDITIITQLLNNYQTTIKQLLNSDQTVIINELMKNLHFHTFFEKKKFFAKS